MFKGIFFSFNSKFYSSVIVNVCVSGYGKKNFFYSINEKKRQRKSQSLIFICGGVRGSGCRRRDAVGVRKQGRLTSVA